VVVLVGITYIYTNKICISVLSNYEMVCVEVSHGSLLCIAIDCCDIIHAVNRLYLPK